jgi:hypothetical protein
MKVKSYIILNTSRKHVNYEEDTNKVPMKKPCKISMYVLFVLHGFKLVVDTYQLFLLFKRGVAGTPTLV